MKKIFATLFAAIIAMAAFAQRGNRIYKPFKLDIAMFPVFSQNNQDNVGLGIALEPKYAVIDQLSVGIRLEEMLTMQGFLPRNNYSTGATNIVIASFLATADYYPFDKSFRPFAGCGLGVYSINSAVYQTTDGTYDDYIAPDMTKFGVMIRGGFEAGHFRLGAEYNIAGNSNYVTPYKTERLKHGYFTIKAGLFILGEKYPKRKYKGAISL